MQNRMNQSIPSIAILCFALSLTACQGEADSPSFETTTEALANIPEELPDLSIYQLPSTWETQDGEILELVDLRGSVVAAVMIYTTCQASCPRLVADMRAVERQVPSDLKSKVKYVLVSIDPEVDTPEQLKTFAVENKMDSDKWVFLHGSPDQVREFAAVLAVSYKKISPVDFSHSNIISVFDSDGVLRHQKEGLGVNNEETIAAIVSLAAELPNP